MTREPIALVIMGVSGSGKSTIAAMLAGRLGWAFEEGDALHPAPNVLKMTRGIPLTDEDRLPWLHRVAAVMNNWHEAGRSGIVTCSALKRRYRTIIIGERSWARLVYLRGSFELIATRLATRQGHFMPSGLLVSQFDTLEEPDPDERAIIIDIGKRPEDAVDAILLALDAEER